MISTLKDWRRTLRLSCICATTAAVVALPTICAAQQQESAAHGQPGSGQQEVDAATKQLMAANGLFQRGLFKLASEEYTSFLAANPGHAQATAARYALAVCQLRLDQFPQAIETLGPVLHDSKFAQMDEALAVLGYCQLATKHYDQASDAFADLRARFPQTNQAESAACYQAQALYLAGKYQEAERVCGEFLRSHPSGEKRGMALYYQALAERGLSQHDRVLQTLAQLTRENSDSPYKLDALLLAGQSLEAQGKLDAAIEQYRQMLASAPEARKADAHYSLGVALFKAARYDEATRELAKVVSDSPRSPYAKPAKLQLGLSELAENKPGEARRTLEEVARDDSDRAAEARYGLAQCDIAERKFESARSMLDTLVHLSPPYPNLPQVLLDRAVCLIELGKFEEAAGELEALRSQHPQASQLPEATYRQAFCLFKLTRYDQSRALCEQIARMPNCSMTEPAAELGAEDLYLMAKYPEAKAAFAAIAGNAKDETKKLRFTLRQGQCEYFAGHYDKAVDVLRPLAENSRVAGSDELRPAIFLCGDALLQQGKNAEAAQMLSRYLSVATGDKSEAQFKLGHAQVAARQTDAARHTFDELTSGPTDSPWVQRGLLEEGQLLYQAGERDRAASLLDRLVSASKVPPDLAAPALYLRGWVEFDQKHYEQAAAEWKKLVDQFSNQKLAIDAAYHCGVALKDAGKLDAALDALRAFAASHPDDPNAPRASQLAAAVLSAQGKHDEAKEILAKLAAGPKSSDAVLYDLAWSQRNTKNLPAAEETYRRLLSLDGDSKLAPAARTELAELLYDDKKYAESAELLERVRADKGTEKKVLAAATYRLGFCYQQLKEWDKAARVFGEYAERFGDDPKLVASALLQAGVSCGEQGAFDRAESFLTRAIEKLPSTLPDQMPVALIKLGEAQAERQEYDRSLHTYQQFLDRFDRNEFAYRAQFGVGWTNENLKQFGPAREAYKKVLAMTNGPTAARAQFQIGETYLAEQKFEQAIPALLAVEDVYAYPKWSARALLEAGRAFEQLKQPARAKESYTQVITKYKDAPEAELAQERMRAL